MDTSTRDKRHAQMRAEARNPSRGRKFDFLKKVEKKWYWMGGGVLIVVFLVVGYWAYTRSQSQTYDFAAEPGYIHAQEASPTTEPVGESVQTPEVAISAQEIVELKEDKSRQLILNVLPSDFLNRPESFKDFVENTPWNWILYVLGAPMMLMLVFRERIQVGEFSDSKLASLGLMAMFLFVVTSGTVSKFVSTAGLADGQFFLFVFLAVGFLLNMGLQFAAFLSGTKDYSVIAMGVYASGLFLNWWFHGSLTSSILGSIGVILMVVGICIQLGEIKRTNSFRASVAGTVLMLVFFVGSYTGIFNLVTTKLATMDPGISFELLRRTQVLVSALMGVGIAMIAGLVYGSIFLKPTSRISGQLIQDGSIDLSRINVLDADSQGLFIMILFLGLPSIWVLPHLVSLF